MRFLKWLFKDYKVYFLVSLTFLGIIIALQYMQMLSDDFMSSNVFKYANWILLLIVFYFLLNLSYQKAKKNNLKQLKKDMGTLHAKRKKT